MKKIQFLLKIFLFIIVFTFSFFSWVLADNTEDESKSIKQLKNNIEVLKSKKVLAQSVFEKFKQENGNLSNYFRKDLSKEEIKNIEEIISKYNENRKVIINQFDILKLKRQVFSDLEKYIDKSKIWLYKDFVEKNIESQKKALLIKKDIEKKKKIIEKKVSSIKKKIIENHKKEEKKLKELLIQKIKQRVYALKNNKKISYLSKKRQIKLFKVVLKKINFIKQNNKKLTQKQIFILIIISDTLVEIINDLEGNY